jgi:hypothetical protein
MQDFAARHRLSARLDDFRHGHHSEMTEEGLFFLGVILGILLHAAVKIVLGLLKAVALGLTT